MHKSFFSTDAVNVPFQFCMLGCFHLLLESMKLTERSLSVYVSMNLVQFFKTAEFALGLRMAVQLVGIHYIACLVKSLN